MPRKILFVCTGNQCRSPMAEALFRHMLSFLPGEADEYVVKSCGTAGFEGAPATGEAIEVMLEEGIDLSCHRSRSISHDLLEEADIIFVMSDRHKDFIDTFFHESLRKVHLLKAYALRKKGGASFPVHALNIPDPIGKRIDAYREVYKDLKYIFESILEEWRT